MKVKKYWGFRIFSSLAHLIMLELHTDVTGNSFSVGSALTRKVIVLYLTQSVGIYYWMLWRIPWGKIYNLCHQRPLGKEDTYIFKVKIQCKAAYE